MPVEACHQVGHRRTAAQAGLARRVEEDARAGHRQQRAGVPYLVDSFARTPGNPLQRRPFRAAQTAQWLT